MYCKKCGTEQKPGQKFCPKCGTPFQSITDRPLDAVRDNESAKFSYSPKSEGSKAYSDSNPVSRNKLEFDYKKILIPLVVLVVVAAAALLGWKYLKPMAEEVLANTDEASDIEAIPFKSMAKGRWGMIKPDGTILFEEEFKDAPTVAREGRFMVRNGNGLWEIYTATEKPQRIGDEYKYLGEYHDGVAPAVRPNERISLIDKDGNVITVLEKSGSKEIVQITNFHYGYALFVAEDGAVGIINTRGEILVPARKYCSILHVAPNRFLALETKYKEEDDIENAIFRVIDSKGNDKGSIRMHKYNKISVLADGFVAIEQISDGETLYGIMDLDGDVILKPTGKIRGLSAFKDGKFVFSNGENVGIRNVKDDVIIRAKYDAIIWATDDMIWTCSVDEGRSEWSLVDLEGNKITKDTYQSVLPFYDKKHAFVQITDKTWGLVNTDGEELKGTPDIYIVSPMTADDVIMSDYVDLDGVISAVNMTPNGFGGFAINKTPAELLRVYNEFCDVNSRIEIDPNSVSKDRLAYEKQVTKGINFWTEVYYSAYMTEQGESHFDENLQEWIAEPKVWTKEMPQYVKMKITGSKLKGHTKSLYKKLASKAKTYGKVYKENDNACIISITDNRGMVLVNTGTEVMGVVWNTRSFRDEHIEQYSNRPTMTVDGQDFIEEIDTIVDSIY